METVVVERTFEEPPDVEMMQAMEKGARWCMELHGVTLRQSFISLDRRRMICVYEAPDAEAVRKANGTAKFPYDRAWSAFTFKPE